MSLLSGDGNAGNGSGFTIIQLKCPGKIAAGAQCFGNQCQIFSCSIANNLFPFHLLIEEKASFSILFEQDEKTIPNIMERIFGQYREQCGKKKLLLNYEYMSKTEK